MLTACSAGLLLQGTRDTFGGIKHNHCAVVALGHWVSVPCEQVARRGGGCLVCASIQGQAGWGSEL